MSLRRSPVDPGPTIPSTGRHHRRARGRIRRRLVPLLTLLTLALSLGWWQAAPVLAATFTVTSTADEGPGTLRQAILDANTTPGADSISFDVTGTIQPLTPLPAITEAVTIDARSSSFGVVIDGSDTAEASGLVLSGPATVNSFIAGLVIRDFSEAGIALASTGSIEVVSNVLGGNGVGIEIGDEVEAVVMHDNSIGTDRAGTADIGNGVGIRVDAAGSEPAGIEDIFIGPGSEIPGNVIANNGTGVVVDGLALGVEITENEIRDNDGLGIDLGDDGVTENDISDEDGGPNHLANFPLITAAGADGISGTVDEIDAIYRVDVYSNTACDVPETEEAIGNGEGATFLGSVEGEGGGPWSISADAVPGTYITATLTLDGNGLAGSTSEFSDCFLVEGAVEGAGDWLGQKSASGGGTIPGDGAVMAAGSDAPLGPAQFTYGAIDAFPDDGASSPSGEWDFYTTAGSAGTIEVPWRWTGFHGFAGVTVRLEAVVISASSSDTVTTLLEEGPQWCDPCVEPSGGFDYEGIAEFEVEPGDIYGFTLSGSNADTNATLRGELVLGTELPTDCADARGLYNTTTNGRYLILPVGGQRYSVHCNDMDDSGKDYLELHPQRIVAGTNFSSYAAGGAAPGTTVTTTFTKLRFDPATLRVDIGDLTFTESEGELTHPDAGLGNPTVTSMPYATAMACNSGATNGTANVDLWGTPFAVDDSWVPQGTTSALYSSASISEDATSVDIEGNGGCGWMTPHPFPDGPFYVFNPGTEALNNAGPQFGLQLRYLTEPAVTLATPTLFAAVTRSGGVADLYVRADGAEATPITVEVSTGTSCTGGALGGASSIGSVSGTTDAEGYVKLTGVDDIASGDYVAVRVTSPATTNLSSCVRASADNFTWPNAFEMGSTAQDALDVAGQARWYKFPIVADQRVTVTLSNLPADYDLAVFKDILKEFESQLVPQDSGDLHQLSAEFAPSVFSPSVFSPSVFSPSVFSPDAYAPSVFSPSVFSPSVFSPSVFSPSVFSPSVFSPSVFSPSVFSPSVFSPSVFSEEEVAQAFSSAQTRSLIGVSATPGTGNESVVVNTWNNTGFFYLRVSGRAGAFDPDDLFTVTVSKSASSCEGVTDTAISDRASAAGAGTYATVILTDSSKLALGSATDPASLRSRLNAFAARAEVDGVLVDVASDPRVTALKNQAAQHIGCPFAVNLVAEEIKSIVDSYRSPSGAEALRYVTIIGDDTVIPFFRYPDQSLLGQESGYIPPVRSDSISEAALRRDYVLSQDAYGSGVSIDIRTNTFPIPGLAVGRLIETPVEIIGMLDAYLAVNGVVRPGSSMVSGYDFLEDAAEAVSTELAAGTGATVNELITPNGVSPDDPRSWTATDLRTRFLGTRHDISFLAGHFSANSALAADFGTSMLTTELAASTVNLQNAIVFSAGCHSGYNLVDGEALQGVSQPLDWAQAFARKRAVLIAGTGYQYGDTDFLEYSERLYRDFAKELRAGAANTSISVGEALARAKRTYLATTQDIRGIHEKALLEATLFGLPMFGVNMPAGRGAQPGGGGAITPVSVPGPTGAPALAAHDLSLGAGSLGTLESKQLKAPPFDVADDSPLANFVSAEWREGPDGVVTNPAEPAIPKDVVNVTATNANQVLRGVGFMGGTYVDVPNVTPLTGAPTTELRGVHAPFVSPVFYPMKLATTNHFGFLGGDGGTNLIVTPAQHRSDDANPGRSIRREFTGLDLRLFYSSATGSVALSDAPTIVSVSSALDGDDLVFTAQVVGDPKVGVQQVWIVSTDGNGTWTPLDLVQCVRDGAGALPAACGDLEDARLWKGVLTGAQGQIRYIVQAVNRLGLVSLDDNLGQYHAAAGTTPAAPTQIAIGTVATSGVAGGTLAVPVTLTAGTAGVGGKLVTVSVGGSSAIGTTGSDGKVTVQVPIAAQPGATQVTASFGGDASHLASSASTAFSVQQASTSLTLTILPATKVNLGTVTTARAELSSGGDVLPFRTVALLVTAPGATQPTLQTVTTDFSGRATLVVPTGAIGTYAVEARFGSVVSAGAATVDLTDAVYGASTSTTTYRVIWPFTGFFAPVDNGSIVNTAKAGSTIPVKFSLGGNRGMAIFATGFPKAVKYTCSSTAPVDEIETPLTSNSGLVYDAATSTYQYNWKTDKKLAGGCYRLELQFADGEKYTALFRFK